MKRFTLAAEKLKPRWNREPSVVLAVGEGPSSERRPGEERPGSSDRSVCVAADLSAGSGQAGAVLHPLDRDDFDSLVSRIGPRLRLELAFCREISFEAWSDFHPDSLCERVPGLALLLEARRAVADPERMQACLLRAGVRLDSAQVEISGADSPRKETVGLASAPGAEAVRGGDLLASMLEARASAAAGDQAIERAIREIGKSSADAGESARSERWRTAIDAVAEERLRAILGHPAFRRLEATWRGLHSLVYGMPSDAALRLFAIDLAPDAASGLQDLLLGGGAAGDPHGPRCDLLVCDFELDAGEASRAVLRDLLELAARLQRPILAGACGSATAIETASEEDLARWSELQRHPGARWLGLCAPRLLARLPYGDRGEPLAAIRCEELPRPARREDLLWASPVFAVAAGLARAGWQGASGNQVSAGFELESLPLYTERAEPGEQGGVIAFGPLEERLAGPHLEACDWMGIIPLVARSGSDAARVVALRSLARSALPGPWAAAW